MIGFKSFLTEAPLAAKSIDRNPIYGKNIAKQIETGTPFELNAGGTVLLKKDSNTIKAFQQNVNVPTEVETTDGKMIKVSSLKKTESIKGAGTKLSNRGDVAEGILATAIFMKFAGMPMNEKTLNNILTKKLKLKKDLTATSSDTPSDDLVLYVNLADNHFASLTNPSEDFVTLRSDLVKSSLEYAGAKNVNRYAKFFQSNQKHDKVKIVADGLGGQRDTKADLYVEWTTAHPVTGEDTTRNLNLNISLKVGTVKQFGQVSGSKFVNQQALWDTFGVSISEVKSGYNKLLDESKVADAVVLSYRTAYNNIKKGFAGKLEDLTPILRLFKAIKNHATLGDNIELVQLDKGSFKKFKFNMTDTAMKKLAQDHKFTVSWKMSNGKTQLPTVTINMDNVPFLSIRSKVDSNNKDGSFYVRNLIEKQKGFAQFYKIK
jgi:hypothetical protein